MNPATRAHAMTDITMTAAEVEALETGIRMSDKALALLSVEATELRARAERAEAQLERMREALEKIAGFTPFGSEHRKEIAIAALKDAQP